MKYEIGALDVYACFCSPDGRAPSGHAAILIIKSGTKLPDDLDLTKLAPDKIIYFRSLFPDASGPTLLSLPVGETFKVSFPFYESSPNYMESLSEDVASRGLSRAQYLCGETDDRPASKIIREGLPKKEDPFRDFFNMLGRYDVVIKIPFYLSNGKTLDHRAIINTLEKIATAGKWIIWPPFVQIFTRNPLDNSCSSSVRVALTCAGLDLGRAPSIMSRESAKIHAYWAGYFAFLYCCVISSDCSTAHKTAFFTPLLYILYRISNSVRYAFEYTRGLNTMYVAGHYPYQKAALLIAFFLCQMINLTGFLIDPRYISQWYNGPETLRYESSTVPGAKVFKAPFPEEKRKKLLADFKSDFFANSGQKAREEFVSLYRIFTRPLSGPIADHDPNQQQFSIGMGR